MNICSICGNLHDDPYGHNAEPVNSGRCCSDCNATVVVPARLLEHYNRQAANKKDEEIK